jgi:hypothetical protein
MNKFFVRGIVYQPRGDWQQGVINDPISDDRILELEQNVVLFKELGINTVFICSSHTSNSTSMTETTRLDRQCEAA